MAKRENSVYAGIAKEIEGKIKSGEYKQGSLLPPERVLKEMYGVERTTVRRALEILAEKGVISKKAGLGNIVGNSDSDAKSKKSTGIQKISKEKRGLIIYISASNDDTDFSKTSAALETICRKSGYSFSTINSSDSATLEKLISSNDCFGVIITGKADKAEIILDKAGIPYIYAFTKESLNRCVIRDIQGATEKLINELYDKGHRRITYIGPESGRLTFTNALLQKGLDYDEDYASIARNTFQSGHDEFLALYRRLSGRFTAVFTASSEIAHGAMSAAEEKSVDVPGQMSFVSIAEENVSDITCAVFDKEIMAQEILLSLENRVFAGKITSCCTSVGFEISGDSVKAAPGSSRRNSMSDFLL